VRVLFAVVLCLLLLLKNKIFDSGLVLAETECIRDHTFIASDWYNNLLASDKQLRDYVLGISAWLIDGIAVYCALKWYLSHSSLRVIITATMVYIIRLHLQDLFFLSFPKSWLWEDPEWFSVTVAYHKTADFYYSGHVALCTTIITEMWATKDYKAYYFSVIVMLIEATMLCFTRVHYIIDLVAGYFCAKYYSVGAEIIAFFWDVWLLGLPAHKRHNYYFRSCSKCGWSNDCAVALIDEQELAL